MKLTDKQIKEWVAFFSKENRLPSLKIPCNTCDKSVTLGHGNLLKRVVKFKGVENLLRSFECRKCYRTTNQKTKEIKKKVRREKKQKKENILTKSHVFVYKGPETIILKDNPEYVAKLTASECWRPDIYLDNDRTCDTCSLHKHCACPIKTLLKDGAKRRPAPAKEIIRRK